MYSIYPITLTQVTLAHLLQHLTNIHALLKFFYFSKAFFCFRIPCRIPIHVYLSCLFKFLLWQFLRISLFWLLGGVLIRLFYKKFLSQDLLSICLITILGLYNFITSYQGCILSTWLITVDVNLITWLR